MNIELTVAIISGVFAIIAGIIAVIGQKSNTKLSHQLELLKLDREDEKEVSNYKEPLIKAAYDLQSRLYNILMMQLLEAYYENGDSREREYVVESTLFLIAQYFCWTEIIRNGIQFIDLGEDEKTKKLSDLINKISQTFLTDQYGNTFRIFAGEQRALGEIMILENDSGRNQCIGYNKFRTDFMIFKSHSIFDYLKEDIETTSKNLDSVSKRLILIQNYLIDLIDYLDPKFIRYPKKYRTKINLD
ncbi:MAG: hypothetical protein WD052_11915 [Bacteroidales bacterium]